MDIWTDTPTEFDPQFVNVIKNSDMEIQVFTGIPYSRVAILQDNELISRGLCDGTGNVVITFDTPVNLALVVLSLTGHNKYRYEQQGLEFVEVPPIRELTAKVDEIVITLEWQEPDYKDGNQPDSYAIYHNGSILKTLPADELSYQDTDELLWNTTYEYCVRALYSVFVSNPVCLPVKTDPYCDIVENLTSTVNGKIVVLRWEKPELFAPKKYSIERDGVFLKETTALFSVDNVPKDSTEYEYCVFALYEDCDSEPICLNVKVGIPTGISETQAEWVQIYPNPTTGGLTITNYELRITDVEVYDIYGRKTASNHLLISSSNQQVDVSHLPNGLYFLRIYTEDSILVKRFIIVH
jgi:hypothetical protein